MKPEILTHPNIPKPLHGLNPRTLLGKDWWDMTREAAQVRTGYKCACCGVPKHRARKHQWLEGHEYFDIDYQTGVCEVISIEPLCHYCHNFIHSGRLSVIIGKEKTKSEAIDILEHGFNILNENNLECFPFTLDLANSLGADTFGVQSYSLAINKELKWTDYVLILNGKEYKSKFKNETEWRNQYL